ncbi:MAG TPA: SDR family NAD(P)-dependent oxidoreductase, partial [Pirellulales bacterium]|nr:SDR family NAD(P)-dependent oxidoreductase [Pirellulales bacterium]
MITGGSRGLGLEMARLWAQYGARVGICARTEADVDIAVDELRVYSSEVFGQSCDITSECQVKKFVAAAKDRWETIDAIVNNAG